MIQRYKIQNSKQIKLETTLHVTKIQGKLEHLRHDTQVQIKHETTLNDTILKI